MARELARACALPFASPSALVLVQARSPDSHHLLIVAQDQHRCVVDAIERREGARAEAIMREHARLGHRNLERAFANQRMLELVPRIEADRATKRLRGSGKGMSGGPGAPSHAAGRDRTATIHVVQMSCQSHGVAAAVGDRIMFTKNVRHGWPPRSHIHHSGARLLARAQKSILPIVVMDSGPAPRGASRNDEGEVCAEGSIGQAQAPLASLPAIAIHSPYLFRSRASDLPFRRASS